MVKVLKPRYNGLHVNSLVSLLYMNISCHMSSENLTVLIPKLGLTKTQSVSFVVAGLPLIHTFRVAWLVSWADRGLDVCTVNKNIQTSKLSVCIQCGI